MRFELIDKVIEQTDTAIKAVKNVSSAEEYLQDHFPGFSVLPGVMMLETLAQAGRKLVATQTDAPKMPLIIQTVRGVKYANMVRPGQQLIVDVTLKKRDGDRFDFVGTGTVEGNTAVTGRFTLSPIPDQSAPR